MLEKDGEDHLDRFCKKWRSIAETRGGGEYVTYNKRKEGRLTGLVTSGVGTAL